MSHYFINDNNIKSNLVKNIIKVNSTEYTLYTDNGVFSKRGLDFGTRLLIEALPLNMMKGNVLDVGCGYGSIGLIIKHETDCEVDMIDINLRALHLTRMNATENKLDVNIYESDAYVRVRGLYDYIVTNPPIRAGKKKVYEILLGAKDFLKDNGELWFVMRKDQGVKSTLFEMKKDYDLSIKSKKKGFFVVCATKSKKIVDNT